MYVVYVCLEATLIYVNCFIIEMPFDLNPLFCQLNYIIFSENLKLYVYTLLKNKFIGLYIHHDLCLCDAELARDLINITKLRQKKEIRSVMLNGEASNSRHPRWIILNSLSYQWYNNGQDIYYPSTLSKSSKYNIQLLNDFSHLCIPHSLSASGRWAPWMQILQFCSSN